jgi:hypothetical protein
MPTNLEIIGINERSGLVTPNLYKQNWTTPTNTTDNYGVLHTRALSDTTTPIYGKGTGIFLDTANGGGDYDINGNQTNYPGSGRLNAIGINTSQWSYGPATPYSVTNTRALSDITTPIYGKGTGLFLDTANGGGSYDINGNQTNYPGSGRVPLMNYNLAIWTFGKAVGDNYSMSHPHALRPTTIPSATSILGTGDVHGKGTNSSTVLNAAGEFVLEGHYDYKGGSWDDIISRDKSIYTYSNLYFVDITSPNTETNWYTLSHPNSQRPAIIPTQSNTLGAGDVKGKGTNSSTALNFAGEYVLAAHYDYKGGSWDDIIARDRNIYSYSNIYFVDVINPPSDIDWYTKSHKNAKAPDVNIAPLPTQIDLLISENGNGDVKGKGTLSPTILDFAGEYVLAAHTNYGGGSWDDIISRKRSIYAFGNLYWVSGSEYGLNHPNSQSTGDFRGKGTNSPILLDTSNSFVLPAHINYSGGSSDDIAARNANITNPFNYYKVDIANPLGTTYAYTALHPNAKAPTTIPSASDLLIAENGNGDVKGKGTGDPNSVNFATEYVLPAHTNYAGGSYDDIISRERSMHSFGNLYWVSNVTGSLSSEYNILHGNALRPQLTPSASDTLGAGDNKGKGTNSSVVLNFAGEYVLAAHTDYTGGSWDDNISRQRSMYLFGNLYWVGTSEYNASNPNALAGADDKGKGTGDGIVDGMYAAHTNYAGGSITDRDGNQTLYPGSGRIKSNLTNETAAVTTVTVNANSTLTVTGNKPFGYGFTTGKDYETNKPACSNASNNINVGTIYW